MSQRVKFLGPLRLESVDGYQRRFELLAPFSASWGDELIEVPAGFLTDLASVPRFARCVVDDDDPVMQKPSVIHDYLYQTLGQPRPDMRPDEVYSRASCDRILREGMRTMDEIIVSSVTRECPYLNGWYGSWAVFRRWLVWAMVRAWGWAVWCNHKREMKKFSE